MTSDRYAVTTLPFLISVPHAGKKVPLEVREICILTPEQVVADGDEGAAEIYSIEDEVAQYVTTAIARAIVDLNRTEDDFGRDGVIKTHTCWDEPIYRVKPDRNRIRYLLDRFYYPYHSRLRQLALSGVVLGIDCHTMAPQGPPIGPDAGMERPRICLSNGDGTCPRLWFKLLRDCFIKQFGENVFLNAPFRGGYIMRTHAAELPWVQLEISRAPFLSNEKKREKILSAFSCWVEHIRIHDKVLGGQGSKFAR